MATPIIIASGIFILATTVSILFVGSLLGGSASTFLMRLAIIRTLLDDGGDDGGRTPLGSLLVTLTGVGVVLTITAITPFEIAAPAILCGSALLLYRNYRS